MIRTRRSRGPRLLATSLTALAVVLALLGLGFWQLRRLAWKEALLAQIARAEQTQAQDLPLAGAVPPYTRVRAVGRFRQDAWALWGSELRDTPAGPVLGAQLIEPLERQGAPPLLVVRGWVPLDPAAPTPRPRQSVAQPPAGDVAVTGYVRPSDRPGPLSFANAPAAQHFVALDTAAIGKALGVLYPARFALVALGSTPPGQYPAPAQHLPRPRNPHLAYAVTWFGLAALLALMYARWVSSLWRSDAPVSYRPSRCRVIGGSVQEDERCRSGASLKQKPS